MPYSPKLFHARPSASPSPSPRKSTILIISCLVIGIAGFLFGTFATISASRGAYGCSNAQQRSVKVVWDTNGNNVNSDSRVSSETEGKKRQKVMGFAGIQTGFGSTGRRRSLRMTWMPSDGQELQREQVWTCGPRVSPYRR